MNIFNHNFPTSYSPNISIIPNDSLIVCDTNAGALVVDIQDDAYTGYPLGAKLTIMKASGTATAIVQSAGSTILATGYSGASPAIKLNGAAVLYHYALDRWLLSGDLE
jgi:hypothetical protein